MAKAKKDKKETKYVLTLLAGTRREDLSKEEHLITMLFWMD
jgi:DNA-directed RNA polymerase subunit K/omega